MIPELAQRCKSTLIEHEKALESIGIATLGLLLILGLAKLSWLESIRQPIRIENTAGETGAIQSETSKGPRSTTGAYVASKSGTRYYLPTCGGVSRIKEENKVWFQTKGEAEARGLLPATNCKGI